MLRNPCFHNAARGGGSFVISFTSGGGSLMTKNKRTRGSFFSSVFRNQLEICCCAGMFHVVVSGKNLDLKLWNARTVSCCPEVSCCRGTLGFSLMSSVGGNSSEFACRREKILVSS